MRNSVFTLVILFSGVVHCQTFEQSRSIAASTPSAKGLRSSRLFIHETELQQQRSQRIFSLGGVDAGGGDFVRSSFLAAGEKIQKYLQETDKGQGLSRKFGLSSKALKSISDVNHILVVTEALIDRTGSIDDAIFKDHTLYLNRDRWGQLFTQKRKASQLVAHELFRLAGYGDENYVISKNLRDLPPNFTLVAPGFSAEELGSGLAQADSAKSESLSREQKFILKWKNAIQT